MKQFYFFFLTLFLVFQESTASSRFQTLLKKFQNFTYKSEDKSLSFLFQSLILPYKPVYIIPVNSTADYYDTVSYRGTYIHGNALYLNQRKDEDSHYKIFNKKSVELLGTIATDGYTVESTISSNGFLDTSKITLSIKGNYTHSLTRYQLKKKFTYPFFYNISTNISGMVYFLHEKNFEPGIENSLKVKKRYKKNKQSVNVLTDFDIGLGAGNPLIVTPLYRTYKFEKKLLRSNLINFKLSEETLLSIAKIVATNSSYEHRKHEELKKLKEQIDSILIKDVAVEQRNLRYISLMEIRKLLFNKSPGILYKPQFRFFSISRLTSEISNTATSHITIDFSDTEFENPDTIVNKNSTPRFILYYEHLLGIKSSFNIPLSHNWFINIHALRNLVSTDKNINFLTTSTDINWDDVLDIRWDFKISTWPVNWFSFQMGMMNIPSWILVPRKFAYLTFAEIGFFMENNIVIKPSILFFNTKKDNDSYSKWFDSDKSIARPIARGFIFRVSTAYYF